MTGPYHTILIDPPWLERGGGKSVRGAQRHYGLLKTPDIIRTVLQAPIWRPADDAHLYLWTTNTFLPDALKCMDAWGFRYLTNVAWVKHRNGKVQMGIGQYFRGAHELMLVGVKGRGANPVVRTARRDLPGVLLAERTKHSRKPEAAYQLIEARSHGPRVELFARTRREGWDAWGHEAPEQEAA